MADVRLTRLFATASNVKISANITIIYPLLEYVACIWDLNQEYSIYEIEKIQKPVARWVVSDYNHYSSVTAMLNVTV